MPRTCVACRSEAPKQALVRIVRAPDGRALLDVTGKLPGRGAYICLNSECLKKARKSGALSRALRTEITEECWGELERCVQRYGEGKGQRELHGELCSLLGMSRRAGALLIGSDAVREAKGRPLLLLTARDVSEGTLRFAEGRAQWQRLALPLNSEALSRALGAGNVQVAALPLRSGLADKVRALAGRLEGLEADAGSNFTGKA